MGSEGAAIATLASRAVELLVVAVYICLVDKKLRWHLSDLFKPDLPVFKVFLVYCNKALLHKPVEFGVVVHDCA